MVRTALSMPTDPAGEECLAQLMQQLLRLPVSVICFEASLSDLRTLNCKV